MRQRNSLGEITINMGTGMELGIDIQECESS